MLNRRLIPKLQMKSIKIGSRVRKVLVTTVQFGKVREIGDPVSQARIFQAQAADELVFLDLDNSRESRTETLQLLKRLSEEIFMPLTVGGGVQSVDDVHQYLLHGADKVSINTAAVENPTLISEASDLFGAQCVVLSIDYKKDPQGRDRVYTRGGSCATDLDPVSWAIEGEKRGAGEILLTSIDRDGTRKGLDLEMTRQITKAVSIPVITSGGCGLASHFVDGFKEGGADAVSAGTYFCFKDENPMQTRSHIKNSGIPIRIVY